MNRSSFPKRSGNHADVLAAVGAADLLSSLDPVLIDRASAIDVQLKQDITPSDLANAAPGFKYLKAKPTTEDQEESNVKEKPLKVRSSVPTQHVFDYTIENEKYKRQIAAKKSKDQTVAQAAQEESADPEFRVYRIAKALQAGSGLNKFVEQFFSSRRRGASCKFSTALTPRAIFSLKHR